MLAHQQQFQLNLEFLNTKKDRQKKKRTSHDTQRTVITRYEHEMSTMLTCVSPSKHMYAIQHIAQHDVVLDGICCQYKVFQIQKRTWIQHTISQLFFSNISINQSINHNTCHQKSQTRILSDQHKLPNGHKHQQPLLKYFKVIILSNSLITIYDRITDWWFFRTNWNVSK